MKIITEKLLIEPDIDLDGEIYGELSVRYELSCYYDVHPIMVHNVIKDLECFNGLFPESRIVIRELGRHSFQFSSFVKNTYTYRHSVSGSSEWIKTSRTEIEE